MAIARDLAVWMGAIAWSGTIMPIIPKAKFFPPYPYGTPNMTASRFACMVVAFWMLGNAALAQRPTVVQIAGEIELTTESDRVARGNFAPPKQYAEQTQGNPMQAETNSWVLTDESIDAIASQSIIETDQLWGDPTMGIPVAEEMVGEISQGECECGQKHCHGVCRDPGHPKKPLITKPGDRDRGDCPPLRYRMDDCERAGNPHCYHRWAKCSVDDKYSAWFVGGGSPFPFARGRTSNEGTWGLDYGGMFGHAKVWLNYTHGRNQGGVGAYRTDGEPKIISRAHKLIHHGH